MTSIVEQLHQLGFSQYEAQAYIALLKANPMNGYELARASGIPRPSVYPVLQKLEERGVVLRIDNPQGPSYLPVDPGELISRIKQNYLGALESAGSALCELTAKPALPTISNLRSYPALLAHTQSIIASSQQVLLLCIWPDEVRSLFEPLMQARQRGVAITTLCLRGCPQACPACQGSVFRYPIAPPAANRWLVLVSDDTEVLAGEITPDQGVLAIRTRQEMLVNLISGYIQNSIALASILTDLGDRFDNLITLQTCNTLEAIHPLQAQGGWLAGMRQIIHSKENIAQ